MVAWNLKILVPDHDAIIVESYLVFYSVSVLLSLRAYISGTYYSLLLFIMFFGAYASCIYRFTLAFLLEIIWQLNWIRTFKSKINYYYTILKFSWILVILSQKLMCLGKTLKMNVKKRKFTKRLVKIY